MSGGRRAVFLDRDGVLVATEVHGGKPIAALTLADFAILPEAPAAVAALKSAGFVTVVVTNQPEMARGNVDSATMDAMHARLSQAMPIDAVYVCPHDSGDGCGCRKPAPGMLLRAADELGLDLASSYMVGDRWRDVGASMIGLSILTPNSSVARSTSPAPTPPPPTSSTQSNASRLRYSVNSESVPCAV